MRQTKKKGIEGSRDLWDKIRIVYFHTVTAASKSLDCIPVARRHLLGKQLPTCKAWCDMSATGICCLKTCMHEPVDPDEFLWLQSSRRPATLFPKVWLLQGPLSSAMWCIFQIFNREVESKTLDLKVCCQASAKLLRWRKSRPWQCIWLHWSMESSKHRTSHWALASSRTHLVPFSRHKTNHLEMLESQYHSKMNWFSTWQQNEIKDKARLSSLPAETRWMSCELMVTSTWPSSSRSL